jgi:hypothetical protein
VYRILTNRWLLAIIIVIPLAAATGTAKLSFDEAIWSYIGTGWLADGARPYVERFDNKPPWLFLAFGLAGFVAGADPWLVRLMGVAATVLTALVLYAIGRRLLDRTAGAAAMIFFGLIMPRGVVDGPYAAHSESFIVLFSALAFYLLLLAFDSTGARACRVKFFLAALSVGVATFFFKQVALGTAGALLAFYLLHRGSARRKTSPPIDLALAVAGLAASLLLSLLPLLLSGVPLEEYWKAVWVSPSQAGATNESVLERVLGFFQTWQNTELFFFAPLLAVFVAQRKRLKNAGVPFAGICVWIIADFLCTNASGNYYGHQLKQAALPMALAGGLGLGAMLRGIQQGDSQQRAAALVVGLCVLLLMPYGVLVKRATMKPLTEPELDLGQWLRANSGPQDTIFPCGPRAMHILAWSGRPMPLRYFCTIFMPLSGARAELDKGLAERPPRYIILPPDGLADVDDPYVAARLEEIMDKSYASRIVIDDYRVYERRIAQSTRRAQ